MKVAVLFTGALRTIRKTLPFLKQNVLLNKETVMFACCQNDSDVPDTEWEQWLAEEIGTALLSFQWFQPSDPHWLSTRDRQLANMAIGASTQHYLQTSGSMIEYYQLQTAYTAMCAHEFTSHTKYEYVVRVRTDTIFAHPIDFHWLQWTEEEIAQRLDSIRAQQPDATDSRLLQYFMTSVIADDTIDNLANFTGCCHLGRSPEPALSELREYLLRGSYILTFRKNLLYIARRDLFYCIPALGSLYGLFTSPHTLPHFRWNAESQFQAACYHSNVAIFDYCTPLEDQSLYMYDEQRYFDTDFKIHNLLILFCLVRR